MSYLHGVLQGQRRYPVASLHDSPGEHQAARAARCPGSLWCDREGPQGDLQAVNASRVQGYNQKLMRPTFVLMVMCTAALACGGGEQQGGPGGGGAAGGRGGFPAMDVKTVTLAPKPIPQTSEFVATIKSLRSTNIQPQVEGIVRQIMVKAGDRVRMGQPLMQIDPEKQQAT